jgi:hypothetical protein
MLGCAGPETERQLRPFFLHPSRQTSTTLLILLHIWPSLSSTPPYSQKSVYSLQAAGNATCHEQCPGFHRGSFLSYLHGKEI